MTTTRGERPNTVVGEYEQWLRSWASERTTSARAIVAAAFLSDYGLDGVTAPNIQEFIGRPNKLTGKPKSKWSKATYHGHFKDFCKWLVATDRLTVNPMEEVHSIKRPKKKPRPLTDSQVDALLSVIQGPVRDQILLALRAGLRVSEIAKIRGEDVSVEGIYVDGKGDVGDILPIHPDLWDMAQRYPKVGYWFPGNVDGHVDSQRISQTVGRIFHGMGIEGSIHRCRHYYCTDLLRRGVHVRRVQRLMRHANLETTAGYAAVDEDELRDAINLLPRLNAMPESEIA